MRVAPRRLGFGIGDVEAAIVARPTAVRGLAVRRRLRGLPAHRQLVGAPEALRALWLCRLLRQFSASPRHSPLRASQHPMIASLEPGEDWWWCYPDELLLEPSDGVSG